ncbi:hypothetical protein OAM91_02915 [Gammaproteobacteria bacterium]|nr:hypothetical protein [Gammaproteobacteria bacterium]
MIEVGKKYLIEARAKKRVTQVEFFVNSSGKKILYDTVYRNGEFMVQPQSDGEAKYIKKFVELDDSSFEEFYLNTLYEFEMRGTFDASADYFRGDITNQIEEDIESSEQTVYEYLTKNGWDHNNTEYYINGAIDIEPI